MIRAAIKGLHSRSSALFQLARWSLPASAPRAWEEQIPKRIVSAGLLSTAVHVLVRWSPDTWLPPLDGMFDRSITNVDFAAICFSALACYLASLKVDIHLPLSPSRTRTLLPFWVALPNVAVATSLLASPVLEHRLLQKCFAFEGADTPSKALEAAYARLPCESKTQAKLLNRQPKLRENSALVDARIAFAYAMESAAYRDSATSKVQSSAEACSEPEPASDLWWLRAKPFVDRYLPGAKTLGDVVYRSPALPIETFVKPISAIMGWQLYCSIANRTPHDGFCWYVWLASACLVSAMAPIRGYLNHIFMLLWQIGLRSLLPLFLAFALSTVKVVPLHSHGAVVLTVVVSIATLVILRRYGWTCFFPLTALLYGVVLFIPFAALRSIPELSSWTGKPMLGAGCVCIYGLYVICYSIALSLTLTAADRLLLSRTRRHWHPVTWRTFLLLS